MNMPRFDSLTTAVNRARTEADAALRDVPILVSGALLTGPEYRRAMRAAEDLMLAAVKLERHLMTLAEFADRPGTWTPPATQEEE